MHPPKLEPTDYGLRKDDNVGLLTPKLTASDVHQIPNELLKLIQCSCKSEIPCKSNLCSCKQSNLSCTVFCSCNENCQNARTDPEEENDDKTDCSNIRYD